MKLKVTLIFLLFAFATLFLQNCASCDDCNISPAPKQLNIVNSKGESLVFGSSKIYDPIDIIIKNNFNETIEFYTNIDNQTLDFTFTIDADTYNVFLTSSVKETIKFTYGKDKNIDCCGEFDVTKSTTLNGVTISNDDLIKIVK